MAAALYVLAGVIVVGPREEAVVTTFGAWTRSYGPGIGYHLPMIERSQKLDVTTLRAAVLVNALLMSLALSVAVGLRSRSGCRQRHNAPGKQVPAC